MVGDFVNTAVLMVGGCQWQSFRNNRTQFTTYARSIPNAVLPKEKCTLNTSIPPRFTQRRHQNAGFSSHVGVFQVLCRHLIQYHNLCGYVWSRQSFSSTVIMTFWNLLLHDAFQHTYSGMMIFHLATWSVRLHRRVPGGSERRWSPAPPVWSIFAWLKACQTVQNSYSASY